MNPHEGRRKLSWIWLVPGLHAEDRQCNTQSEEFLDGTRVEWAMAKARVDRWREEKEMCCGPAEERAEEEKGRDV